MTTRTITAVYDSDAQAQYARDRLVANGLDAGNVQIVSHALSRGEGAGDAGADKSIWESLGDFILANDDRPLYSESLRRGACLLTAHVDESVSDAAISLLEDTDPVDLEERAQQWRDEGWSAEGLGTPASMHGYAPGTGPTTEAIAEELRRGAAAAAAEEDARQDEPLSEVRIYAREVDRGSVRVRSYIIQTRTNPSTPRDRT
jgi:hypothetical protein